ncbi:MAG: hypothetical protein AAFQ80_16140 [Cyanobacteria bacterium J06621_8]
MKYDANSIYDATLAEAILNSIQNILDLNNLALKNASFKINKIDIGQGKIILAGQALVKDFTT